MQRTEEGKWRCVVPRASTQFLIPYLKRHGTSFTAKPEAAVDYFEFPGELTSDALKALIRGFGARIPRPGETDTD